MILSFLWFCVFLGLGCLFPLCLFLKPLSFLFCNKFEKVRQFVFISTWACCKADSLLCIGHKVFIILRRSLLVHWKNRESNVFKIDLAKYLCIFFLVLKQEYLYKHSWFSVSNLKGVKRGKSQVLWGTRLSTWFRLPVSILCDSPA